MTPPSLVSHPEASSSSSSSPSSSSSSATAVAPVIIVDDDHPNGDDATLTLTTTTSNDGTVAAAAAASIQLRMSFIMSNNPTCVDCSDEDPTYVTLICSPSSSSAASEEDAASSTITTKPVLGALCCLKCSGHHRSLLPEGQHIIKSCETDNCKYFFLYLILLCYHGPISDQRRLFFSHLERIPPFQYYYHVSHQNNVISFLPFFRCFSFSILSYSSKSSIVMVIIRINRE